MRRCIDEVHGHRRPSGCDHEQGDDLIDKFLYTLFVRRKVVQGLADAGAGDEISHDEIVTLSDGWLD